MTTLLALDTSSDNCSVALWHQGQLWHDCQQVPRGHTRLLMPMIRQLLDQAGAPLAALDGVAFGAGPGSFTGLRITLGVAQGLAWGLGRPVIPVSCLAATAAQAARLYQARQVAVAFDARMDQVYWGAFHCSPGGETGPVVTALGEERVCAAEAVTLPGAEAVPGVSVTGSWFAAGSGWQAYPDRLKTALSTPMEQIDGTLNPLARDILLLALEKYQAGLVVAPEQAEPVYLRNEISWQKLPGR
ncbi:MAG: tRNA (adenosine(37)-N6)-threonylcarbamoyltransferase complex dimerization subunit type 1 TsaB [Halomonadaceae bacterium]|nr:MAG: tRNA (adenosine(37)-N6)-threonylcarbamoyltransferase complex dimerization subunit type 1 TsaB [Halomonadaceae bacterium]